MKRSVMAPLAGRVLGDVERLRALEPAAARRERAGAVIDMAVAVGVVGIGRARRHVGEQDHAAVRRQPLGQRRHRQRAAGDATLVLQEARDGRRRDRRGGRPPCSASVLPCSSWRAGWQPVANEAETTRVAEGNIERCAAKPAPRERQSAPAPACVSSPIRSRRMPSSTTTTARRIRIPLNVRRTWLGPDRGRIAADSAAAACSMRRHGGSYVYCAHARPARSAQSRAPRAPRRRRRGAAHADGRA